MEIKPDEIASILRERIEGLETESADLAEVGTVLSVADGIARVHGLDNCMSLEMLELPHDVTGLALNLEADNVGAVLFGEWDKVVEGDTVKRTGHAAARSRSARSCSAAWSTRSAARSTTRARSTPPRPARPSSRRPASSSASRSNEPVQTGLKAIDGMIPIGRGQRELIIGDRQTGKTAIAIDTIINNRDKDLVCIYVAIGQRMSTVVQVMEMLEENGAMENTIIVAAPADEAAPIKYMAPYAGCAMGEHFLYNGKARALRLRRPHQARLRLPADVAAAAPPAGPRGLPGRRLLPALAPARAGREAERRARRRLADRAADHRDAGQRRLGLHPDQRHLDHRRPDLPGVRPVLLGRAAGDQRRHLGLAGGRQRADQGDEEGGRQAAPGPLPVPRPRGVRAVRLRARPGDPEARWPAASGWSRC